MSDALAIDQEEMIGAGTAGDVDIFAELDGALAAEEEEAAVAPDAEAGRGEPVDPVVTARVLGAEQDVAEILEFRAVRVIEIADLAGDHLGLVGFGEEKELLELVG